MYRPQKKLGKDFMAWPTTTKKYDQSIPSSSLLTICSLEGTFLSLIESHLRIVSKL